MKISVLYSTMIVKNLEESAAFYRDVLKFTEGYHVDLPFGGITIMESPDGACVELIEAPQFEVGLYSVGTDVDDLDATIKALKEKGCEPLGEIAPTSVGRQVFIQDPNGVRICLIEHTDEYKENHMLRGSVIENMITRRSIRKYKSEPIPSKVLETILESGRYAPSGSNTQKSHFLVFHAGQKLEKLKKLVVDGLAAMNAEDYSGFPARHGAILRLQKGYFDFIYNAPHLVVVANEITYPNNMADSALTTENMMLAAHSLGIGSCYINLVHWAADVPEVRSFLLECGMKASESVYASVALGYPDMPIPEPPARTGNEITVVK